MTSEQAVAGSRLPPLHEDLFDRIPIAQAKVEGATLLTVDTTMARYAGPMQLVG